MAVNKSSSSLPSHGNIRPSLVASEATPQKWTTLEQTSDLSKPRQIILNGHCFEDEFSMEYEQKLKDVRELLKSEELENQIESLMLVDAIQRLGIDYHFQEEIEAVLRRHYMEATTCSDGYFYYTLHDLSLLFRLLREHGFSIPADIFNRFKGKDGVFEGKLKQDIRGLMELYEAAQLVIEGEDILDEAAKFSGEIVSNRLKHPYHKSIARFTAKKYIRDSEGINGWRKTLKELAKMNTSVAQTANQQELAKISKWDHAVVHMLPKPWKMCYKALLDTTNDIGYKIYKKHGYNPIDSLKSTWASLCDAFLVEAKWFASGHLPTSNEYLENGKVSSGVHVVLVHLFFLLGINRKTEGAVQVHDISDLISSVATILRLWDDFGSAKDEQQDGNDGSYIDCYMKENPGSTIEIARDRVVNMISSEWKGLNKECFLLNQNSSNFSFTKASLNLARMVPLMYSYDDNQQLPVLEEFIKSTLFDE
ncbi:tricyclene synthase Oc15, chloroplastic-like isoform X2 [Olea europaea var. sylvestris]|uniref:tricyclene synthase Oc15, chloroplastic-like isoform X2 n=1 Tax=Olea europaea var. sylvestris TaxID=158386 RepID=UPI000C1D4E65|nr:tricyclene synthase Oc15, chloroplastic-like isoform X2 [Olea europaea var. sylvestris]